MHRAILGLIEAGMTSDRAIRNLSHLMLGKGMPRGRFVPISNNLKEPTERGEHWTIKGQRALSRRTFNRVKEDFKKLADLGILAEERHGNYRRYEVNPTWAAAIRAYVNLKK